MHEKGKLFERTGRKVMGPNAVGLWQPDYRCFDFTFLFPERRTKTWQKLLNVFWLQV